MKLATGLFIGVLGLSATAVLADGPNLLQAQYIGMVASDPGMALVFNADPLSVLGGLRLADYGTLDCTISPDGRRGFVVDGRNRVWVINLTSNPPALAAGVNPIAISGPAVDAASTVDGRFLLLCDGTSNLVSVVDTADRIEIGAFGVGARCSAIDVCSDGSVLVASDQAQFVRRLTLDAGGHLSATGQQLAADAMNVYCSPNGAAGVAMSQSGHLRSFRTSGMIAVSDRNLPAYGGSGVMGRDGTRFYGRSFDGIDAYDFDQATGELGAAPVFSVSVGSDGLYNFGGADQVGLDPAGSAVYTPERFQISVNDAVTGAPKSPLLMPDLEFSGGICFGPNPAVVCNVADCDDANPCTDDVCGDTGCLHVPDDSNRCGDASDCLETKVCSGGACVVAGPADCNRSCPIDADLPGDPIMGSCQKTYDIDASKLDHLDESCDGNGTNRFNCGTQGYGFHWTDKAGDGVGRIDGVHLWIMAGTNCEAGPSGLLLNGVPVSAFESSVDCSCNPGHAPTDVFLDPAAYVKGGLNTITILPSGSCEGMSTSPILDGFFARVHVSYVPLDSNCATGACNSATHRCEYAIQNCDDGNPCTDDTCAAGGGCVHTPAPEYTDCGDGNYCNGNEYCHDDGTCYADYPPSCFGDGNPCTLDRCDPIMGCTYDPIDCDDRNPCTDDACDTGTGLCTHSAAADGMLCQGSGAGSVGGTCHGSVCVSCSDGTDGPNPRSVGYYERLCAGPHSGDQLTDADAVCVASIAHRFSGYYLAYDLCSDVLQPRHAPTDPCGRALEELLALALNICRGRVCAAQPLDSHCGATGDAGASLSESDSTLGIPSRSEAMCGAALCLGEEINDNSALEMSMLTLAHEGSGVRLTWPPPDLPPGGGSPSAYHVWRRILGSLAPFSMLATTTEPTFLDLSAGAFEYEVTAVRP